MMLFTVQGVRSLQHRPGCRCRGPWMRRAWHTRSSRVTWELKTGSFRNTTLLSPHRRSGGPAYRNCEEHTASRPFIRKSPRHHTKAKQERAAVVCLAFEADTNLLRPGAPHTHTATLLSNRILPNHAATQQIAPRRYSGVAARAGSFTSISLLFPRHSADLIQSRRRRTTIRQPPHTVRLTKRPEIAISIFLRLLPRTLQLLPAAGWA
jgi:hypothetical protein